MALPGATRAPGLTGSGQAGCDLPAFAMTVLGARPDSNRHRSLSGPVAPIHSSGGSSSVRPRPSPVRWIPWIRFTAGRRRRQARPTAVR
jgi:hypothetical protein